MLTVRQILKGKGNEVFSVPSSTSIADALRLMAEKEIGALMVVDGETIRGIFSERDYARRCYLLGCSESGKIDQLMTKTLVYVGMDDTVEDCMTKMTDKRIRHLPVVQDGKLVGLVSIGDVVKAIITEQKNMIRNMEDYIQGRGYAQ